MFLPKKKETGYDVVNRIRFGNYETYITTITGEDAKRLLADHANCRKTNRGHVNHIKRSIEENGYNPHASEILYSSRGREDGTHRLTAIMEIGGKHEVAIKVVPEGTGVKGYFDSGKARGIADIANVNSIDLSPNQWATINLFSRLFLGNAVNKHEKHLLYVRLRNLFDQSFELFATASKGHHHVFAACWVFSQIESDCVKGKTRESLADFCLWLNDNYRGTVDAKGGAVCNKLRDGFSSMGNHVSDKAGMAKEVLRYSVGRRWEKQKNRTEASQSAKDDAATVDKWVAGLKWIGGAK